MLQTREDIVSNSKFSDYINFMTKDGTLFTTRGDYHPKGFVRAVPCYRVHKDGERSTNILPGKKIKREVDEFGDGWIKSEKPSYVRDFGLGTAIYVPVEDITMIFDPFDVSKENCDYLMSSKYGTLITTLVNLGVPKEDIGVYGSRIAGLENANSDLDLVIRGKDNMLNIKSNISKIHSSVGSTSQISKDQFTKTISKYNNIYNPKINNFESRIHNRWSTIQTDEYMLKLMFVPKSSDSLDMVFPKKSVSEITLTGEVISDENTCFMPREFKIKCGYKVYSVITYFYHFYFSVKKGDLITIHGSQTNEDSLILLHDRKKHGIKFENEPTKLYKIFEKNYNELVLPFITKNLPKNDTTRPIWDILERFHWRRFRSGIPLLFADAYGISKDELLPIAAASEVIFGISLVQDDIIDEDVKRGNHPAGHVEHGIPFTLAACDNVYGYVFDWIKGYPPKVLEQFFFSHKELYQSFIIELMNKGNIDFSLSEIKDVYYKKTVTGLNALYTSALVCNSEDFAKDVLAYSKKLSIAGQIKNDIYDLVSWQKYPQLRGYSDLKNTYVTYVIRKLLDIAEKKDRIAIVKAFKETNEKVILEFIKKYSIINKCIEDAKEYVLQAKEIIRGKYPEVESILMAWAEGHARFNKL